MYIQSSVYTTQLYMCLPTSLHNTSGERSSPVRVCPSKETTSGKHEPRCWSCGHSSQSTGSLWRVAAHHKMPDPTIHTWTQERHAFVRV